jgi:hypothetical protein
MTHLNKCCIFCIFDIFALLLQLWEEAQPNAVGLFQGVDYDMYLHYTIGHLRRADGAFTDFADCTKTLDFVLEKESTGTYCTYFTYYVYYAY